MTVIMRKSLCEKCLLQVDASSVFGNGTLYLTNCAVIYEVYKQGIYLNFIPLETVKRLDVSKLGMFEAKKCRLEWSEGESTHHMEFRIKQYKELESKLHISMH